MRRPVRGDKVGSGVMRREWRDLATIVREPRLWSEVERPYCYFLGQWTFKTWNVHKGNYRSEDGVNKHDLLFTNDVSKINMSFYFSNWLE